MWRHNYRGSNPVKWQNFAKYMILCVSNPVNMGILGKIDITNAFEQLYHGTKKCVDRFFCCRSSGGLEKAFQSAKHPKKISVTLFFGFWKISCFENFEIFHFSNFENFEFSKISNIFCFIWFKMWDLHEMCAYLFFRNDTGSEEASKSWENKPRRKSASKNSRSGAIFHRKRNWPWFCWGSDPPKWDF